MTETEFAPERVEAVRAACMQEAGKYVVLGADDDAICVYDRRGTRAWGPGHRAEAQEWVETQCAFAALRADAAWQAEQAAQRAVQAYASVARLEAELERDPENASLQINLAAQRKLAVQAISDLPRVTPPEERASQQGDWW